MSKELDYICKWCDNKSCPWVHYEKTHCCFYNKINSQLEAFKTLKEVLNLKIVDNEDCYYVITDYAWHRIDKKQYEILEKGVKYETDNTIKKNGIS